MNGWSKVGPIAAISLITLGCNGGGGAGGEPSAESASTGTGIALTRDAALGARYGAPGPRGCAPKTAPADGPPSSEQAAAYVICDSEHESARLLYLVDQVTVSVSKGRQYNPIEDRNFGNIDIDKPIYAIRGTLVKYQCDQVGEAASIDPASGPRTNCTRYQYPNATGACYKDTFGDWSCGMTDAASSVPSEEHVAPPAA